ncbi:MAG: YidC/Oxa1 family insertase periplasmic-domain containing protein, partial [Saprospiraceae bacterium]
KYFEQTYTINGEYELDYDIQFKNLGDVIVGGTENINLKWVNYLDKIERSTDYEKTMSTVYFKEVEDNMSYCGCQGDDTQEAEKPIKWVAHSNQFFNAALIADKGFSTMSSSTIMPLEEETFLKKLTSDLAIPYSDNSTFGMSFYTGPKEYNRLSAVGGDENTLELEGTIAYGRSILGTINRYVIRPLFGLFSGFIGNKGLVILIITILIKLLLFPLTYKMLYSQAKMAALKPQIEALKKKIGDDSQAQQVETMKLYRETGVNPLGGCLPMVIQMPIWIALYRFFPASIEFRQESFLWATDLASFDVITWLPFNIPFYGAHISLFTILWAISTVAYSYYNSKHMDMSANPAMKYVQYLMPIMFLFFFNSFAASLTCYMFFSSLFNIAQTLITKNVIINNDKV